eukprot:CAMPEP_0195537036 /NCGR_PEP_ID=MMETSP0794_2-20130614/47200_1 /TAXON_ID=515487 /ORGANISM="Stephanopyxis turris, Strain CCMP 815" /LENGTH=142 /DNA_ID=CAMNT_0040670635 /DNA_START=50 /DNA_END=475 /DNA_ORIENTATION=-
MASKDVTQNPSNVDSSVYRRALDFSLTQRRNTQGCYAFIVWITKVIVVWLASAVAIAATAAFPVVQQFANNSELNNETADSISNWAATIQVLGAVAHYVSLAGTCVMTAYTSKDCYCKRGQSSLSDLAAHSGLHAHAGICSR